jgi:hypothetical protein
MKDESMKSEDADYVWHFKFSDDRPPDPTADALAEMVREQLRALLGCVVLTRNGSELRVTGFRFLGDLENEHLLYPEGTVFPILGKEGAPEPE